MYLSSRDDFAIYDLFGKVLDEYELRVHGEESIMVGEYLVTFGMERVVSEAITAQSQSVTCYSRDSGEFKDKIITEGICGEYNGTIPQDFGLTEICTYE